MRSTPPASEEEGSRRRRLKSSSSSSVSSAVESSSAGDENSSSEDEDSANTNDEEEGDGEMERGGEEMVTVGGAKKPAIGSLEGVMCGARGLRERLGALLPRLAVAEETLGQEGVCMEGEGEGGRWIEMDLGLGVLEEVGESEEERETSEGEGGERDDVMDRLMGRGKSRGGANVGIEELG